MELIDKTICYIRRCLIARLRKKYYPWCKHLGLCEWEIQDLLEDTSTDAVVEVNNDIQQWDADEETLLYRSWFRARTLARDRLLKRERRKNLMPDLVAEKLTVCYDDPITQVLNRDELRGVFLTALKPEQRKVLGLYYIQGVKVEQIAVTLQYEANTIYSLLRRARLAARQALQELENDNTPFSKTRYSTNGHPEAGIDSRSPPKSMDRS